MDHKHKVALPISINPVAGIIFKNEVSMDSFFYSACFAASVKHRVWHLLIDAHMVIPVDSK